jgi:hypothetical protein
VLDTSVVIDLERVTADQLPADVAITTITLAAGPLATTDLDERARRQDRLQRAEATFDPLPFDTAAARAYGRIFGWVSAAGRMPRRRQADLLIAAISLSAGLPLSTSNPADFAQLDGLVVVPVVPAAPAP